MDTIITNIWQIEEEITIFTPLGIRFWDPVNDRPVSEGLKVTASPKSTGRPTVEAFKTASGIYAFQGLPGLHSIEYPQINTQTTPASTRSYLIKVIDKRHRFFPVVFYVDLPLPYKGIYLNNISSFLSVSSPPSAAPKGFYLFSAPTRSASSGLAIITGTLHDNITEKPAKYAFLEVKFNNNKKWYGISDERGCFTILFPYPTMEQILESPPVFKEEWKINIQVRYQPDVLNFPPSINISDLHSILGQTPGKIWKELPGSPGPGDSTFNLPVTLTYGKPIILRTKDQSELWIEA